jgi:hypothetical protein
MIQYWPLWNIFFEKFDNRMRDMKMDRSVIDRIHLKKDADDGYVNASRTDLIAMVWISLKIHGPL